MDGKIWSTNFGRIWNHRNQPCLSRKYTNVSEEKQCWKISAGNSVSFRRSGRSCRGGKDRKSTRLNSSHANISYAVFCLKKKKNNEDTSDWHRSSSDVDLS